MSLRSFASLKLACANATSYTLIPVGYFFRESFCLNQQAAMSPGASDEIDNRPIADQRPVAPVLGIEGKHPMLNIVPLEGPEWELANPNDKRGGMGEPLHADLPPARPRAITATRICHHQPFGGVGIGLPAHVLLPGEGAVAGNIRGARVHPVTDTTVVLPDIIIDFVGYDLAQILVPKVVHHQCTECLQEARAGDVLMFPSGMLETSHLACKEE